MRSLLVGLVLVMLGGIGLVGYSVWSYRQQADIAVQTEPAAPGSGEIVRMVIAGPITAATVTNVNLAVSQARRVPSRFVIRSSSGSEAAARDLAALINRLGADVEVTDRALCASVCVSLLSEVDPEHRRIDDGAWLRVAERGNRENGAKVWAAEIGRLSANWLGFLSSCPILPRLMQSGIVMTWGEIESLGANTHAFSCADLSARTPKWLSGVTDANLFVHAGP